MGNLAEFYGDGFDTSSVEPSQSFEPIPAGWYPVMVEAAEIKQTKRGDGSYLKLTLCVQGDNYHGRKIFSMITLANPNPKAVEIGQRDLAAVGQACGLSVITDSSQLVDKVIDARVKIEPAKGDYEAQNRVTAYRATSGVTTTPKPAPQAARPAAAPATAARPWERG